MKRWFVIFLMCLSPVALAHPVDMEAVAWIESSNNPNAVGEAGEVGLYQITPVCLKHFNQATSFDYQIEEIANSETNSLIANWYMNWLYDRTYTVMDTLIAYNWGIGNWRDWKDGGGDTNDLPETTVNYLKKYEVMTGEVFTYTPECRSFCEVWGNGTRSCWACGTSAFVDENTLL